MADSKTTTETTENADYERGFQDGIAATLRCLSDKYGAIPNRESLMQKFTEELREGNYDRDI